MAIGSWVGPPIFPTIDPFVSIIEETMNHDKKVDVKKAPHCNVDDSEESISTSE